MQILTATLINKLPLDYPVHNTTGSQTATLYEWLATYGRFSINEIMENIQQERSRLLNPKTKSYFSKIKIEKILIRIRKQNNVFTTVKPFETS